MKRKRRVLVLTIILLAILVREEIYFSMNSKKFIANVNQYVCTIENQEIEYKYQELSKAYPFEDVSSFDIEYTKVLYRNIYNMNQEITIYKGSANGIRENHLVINEKGLVGIVTSVNKNSSEVMLLKNPNLKLSVQINDCYGILKYENHQLLIDGITNQTAIHIGDEIKTSDISMYPDNILIGKVADIYFDNYEIEKKVIVTEAVDFNALKYLGVITKLRGPK